MQRWKQRPVIGKIESCSRVFRLHFSTDSQSCIIFINFCIYDFVERTLTKYLSMCAFVIRAVVATKQFSSALAERSSQRSAKRRLIVMHFIFVHNMAHITNWICCCFIYFLWLGVTKWHQQRHEKIYHEKKRRRENIFGDAIIWFISAHVCSSFRCASLCVSSLNEMIQQTVWGSSSSSYHIINSSSTRFRNIFRPVNDGNVWLTKY